MEGSRVFLDTSAIITALLSKEGGSFYILNKFKYIYKFQVNEYVLSELLEVLADKFSFQDNIAYNLFTLFKSAKIETLPNPTKASVKLLYPIINGEDAPVLASAIRHSDFLITLDNDFFEGKVKNFAGKNKLVIAKPGDFINMAAGRVGLS